MSAEDQSPPATPPRRAVGGRLEDRRSYAKVARASVIWGYLRATAQALITIPVTVILARLLSPEEFGIAAAATFFAQLSSRLATGGLGAVIVRQKHLRRDHISTVAAMNIGVTAVIVVVLLAAAPLIGRYYDSQEVAWLIPVVAVTFVLSALSLVQQSLLNRDLRYRETATMATLDTTVTAVVSIGLAALGFRYWSLVLGDMSGALVKFVYGVRVAGWHLKPKFVPATAREIGSFAAGSYFKKLLEYLTANVDNVVVGGVLGMTALGFYDKAFSFINKIYSKLTVAGPGVSFRIFSALQDEPERLRAAYHKVVMTSTLMTYGPFAAIVVMAPHLVLVLLGEKWRPAIVPLQVLCASFALKVMNQYAITASNARGWIWPHVGRQIVGVLCVVAGVYYAAPRWGINGAAVAVLCAAVVTSVLTQGITRKATGLRWSDTLRPQAPAVVVSLLVAAALWAVDALLSARAGSAAILTVQAATAGIVALAFAVWCPFREVRVLLHDAVNDYLPRLAARLWNDVAVTQQEDRRLRRELKKAAAEAQAPFPS